MLSGNNIVVPALLSPDDFDWVQSRPLKRWSVGPGPGQTYDSVWWSWKAEPIALIQLLTADITAVLCVPRERDRLPARSRGAGLKAPSEAMVRETINAVYDAAGENPPNIKDALKAAPEATVRAAIKETYDRAAVAGEKPPNIKELPDAVQPLLEAQGYTASKRAIQKLGDASVFKKRRGPIGKTVASQRRSR